ELGLSLELEATNRLTRSRNFTTGAWTKARASIVPAVELAVDGTLGASRLVEDSTAGDTHLMGAGGMTITAGARVCGSAVLRAGPTRGWARLRIITGSDLIQVYVNISTGTVGTANAQGPGGPSIASFGVEPLGGGAFLAWISGTLNAS